jgi:hypothetical protein
MVMVATAFWALMGSSGSLSAAVVNLLVGAADGVVREYDLATGGSEGNFVSGLGNVIGVATLGGDVYVGSYANSNVHRYAYPIAGGGSVVVDARSVNNGSGDSGPRGLTFGPDRSGDSTADLYVTDQLNRQIRVYAGPLETGTQQPGAFRFLRPSSATRRANQGA